LSSRSATGACTGGQNKDSAGCAVVSPFCNLGGNDACTSWDGMHCELASPGIPLCSMQ
jgi:hypothetical protein